MSEIAQRPLGDALIVYVIGAQRAGTTWLYSLFALNNAEILVQEQKEVDFWNTHFPPNDIKYRRRARLRYLHASMATIFGLLPSKKRNYGLRRQHFLALNLPFPWALKFYGRFLFNGWNGQSLVADVSPSYSIVDADALAKAAETHDCRFILVLRDPIERAISATNYFLMANASRAETFDMQFEKLVEGDDIYGDYQSIVERLCSAVPEDRRLILFYEELVRSDTCVRISTFLGLKKSLAMPTERVNGSRRFGLPGPTSIRAAARRYRSTYEFCGRHFNGRLPENWLRNWALADRNGE